MSLMVSRCLRAVLVRMMGIEGEEGSPLTMLTSNHRRRSKASDSMSTRGFGFSVAFQRKFPATDMPLTVGF